jgi:hypothetical protein
MIIDNLNLKSIAVAPHEADAVLIVDAIVFTSSADNGSSIAKVHSSFP